MLETLTCSLWGSAISVLAKRVCQVELRMSDCLGIVRAEGAVGSMVLGVIGGKEGRKVLG